MSKPYDASTKFLLETFFPDWLVLAPLPGTKAEVIDSDLSTITASADKVLRVIEPEPWILHLELQASRDEDLSRRVHWYNALLEYRHEVPVHSLVVLLRREAWSSDLTGSFERVLPGNRRYRTFDFQVLKLWEAKADDLLNGGVGLLPLAPLTDDAVKRLPEVVARVRTRIERDINNQALQGSLLAATDILLGLRYEAAFIDKLLQGALAMKESSTYQAILREGEIKALQGILLKLGRRRFGQPSGEILTRIQQIYEHDLLESLCEKLVDAQSWEELLS